MKPRPLPKHITDAWADMQAHRTAILEPLLARLRRSQADADADYHQTFAQDRIHASMPLQHRQGVKHRNYVTTHDHRAAAVGGALAQTVTKALALEPTLRAYRSVAVRPLTPVEAWVTLQGGDLAHVDVHTQMQAAILHELTLTRLATETAGWPPSRVRALYDTAVADLDNPITVMVAASTVAFVEGRHGDGWSGPTPDGPGEEDAAIGLRRSVAMTQSDRIPPEVDLAEQDIAGIRELAGRIKLLDQVPARNPDRDPQAAEALKLELAAEAQEAAQAAGAAR